MRLGILILGLVFIASIYFLLKIRRTEQLQAILV
jgi:hypothetical protein